MFNFAKVKDFVVSLFRKAYPNCFAKLLYTHIREADKLFNLTYSSHIINYVLCEIFPKLPEDFANFSLQRAVRGVKLSFC